MRVLFVLLLALVLVAGDDDRDKKDRRRGRDRDRDGGRDRDREGGRDGGRGRGEARSGRLFGGLAQPGLGALGGQSLFAGLGGLGGRPAFGGFGGNPGGFGGNPGGFGVNLGSFGGGAGFGFPAFGGNFGGSGGGFGAGTGGAPSTSRCRYWCSRGERAEQRSNKENNNKRNTNRMRKKDSSFTHADLACACWSMTQRWLGLVVVFVLWLCHLVFDVSIMSSRLLLHLLHLTLNWSLDKWSNLTNMVMYYTSSLTSYFRWNKSEEKKVTGRGERKSSRGLDCNIGLPTTGEEAMKRLLACRGKDPYSILGVTRDANDDDIKKYYKRQAILVHPDKNKQPGAEEAFKILAHAFELIGQPERRCEYDAKLEEETQMEGAWGELASLLTRLQEKLEEAANTIRCTNCNKRHRRTKLPRPIYAARLCNDCNIHHASREGDIWAESVMFGLRWRYYACMEGAVYDISEWAACQSENLKHLQANTHSVQYRIVSGKKTPAGKNNINDFPSDPDLEEFFNNLCREKFGKNYTPPSSSTSQHNQQAADVRKRKGKKKK